MFYDGNASSSSLLSSRMLDVDDRADSIPYSRSRLCFNLGSFHRHFHIVCSLLGKIGVSSRLALDRLSKSGGNFFQLNSLNMKDFNFRKEKLRSLFDPRSAVGHPPQDGRVKFRNVS